MILLDTNVLSELMRPTPDPYVVKWLDARLAGEVWICSVTVAEIRLGILRLPAGKRKALLLDLVKKMFQEDFHDRCLPFDFEAAFEYAVIVDQRNRQGHPISVEDAQIAAIAKTAELALTTRNTKDFSDIEGLTLLNPWVEKI
ncbi:MAG: type II toxin-antitoxin system VapC family toxin [Pseudomonadota bacterium]